MQLKHGSRSMALIYLLALCGCAHTMGSKADVQAYQAKRDREVKLLVAQPTPDNLATAAVLTFPGDPNKSQSAEFIERAVSSAPQRAELVWLQLQICRRSKCDTAIQIDSRLQALDPDNGFAWMTDLERAQTSGSDAAVTAAIVRMGAGSKMTVYSNRLEVMTVDGMAVSDPSRSLAMRGLDAIGLVSTLAIPPLRPISKACQAEQLELPGRRAACEALMMRLEHSDTVLTQSLALSVQERWWADGSPELAVVREKRRRLDYLMFTSGRERLGHLNRDMALRIAAARHTAGEEDVELALVRSFGLPTQPPVDWKDTRDRG
jgi:hypothetical protein